LLPNLGSRRSEEGTIEDTGTAAEIPAVPQAVFLLLEDANSASDTHRTAEAMTDTSNRNLVMEVAQVVTIQESSSRLMITTGTGRALSTDRGSHDTTARTQTQTTIRKETGRCVSRKVSIRNENEFWIPKTWHVVL
jgi:hypothetical protein